MPSIRAIGEACADNGGDIVELGVPFSDPLADGPVIHAAATRALREGATVHHVLELGEACPITRCSCCWRSPRSLLSSNSTLIPALSM